MIFVEGMFIFKIPKLREFFDFNIFVEVDDDIRLSRMCKTKILIYLFTHLLNKL
jgi:uridine kinase